MTVIRAATLEDVPAITRIYSHYVLTHTATFEIDPPDAAEMAARLQRILNAELPYLVHRNAGFVMVGTLRNVGFKFDRWLDTVLMQRTMESAS